MFVAVIWLKIATSELTIDWVMNFLMISKELFVIKYLQCH